MGNIKDLFVSYEIAKQLKEKGFNEPCLQFYKEINGAFYTTDNAGCNSIGMEITYPFYNFEGFTLYDTKLVCAPLYQQVVDWFREKYGIDIIQDKELEFSGYVFYLYKGSEEIGQSDLHPEYYDALNEAIEESIKLISSTTKA